MPLVEFLSPEWIAIYQANIREGTAGEDLSGVEFGMYELFKNVPTRLQHGGAADILFGYRISGGRLEFPDRPWDSATVKVVADFDSVAPWVDLPTEQSNAVGVLSRLAKAGKLQIFGDPAETPAFIQKLKIHDRMVGVTAPYVRSPFWGA